MCTWKPGFLKSSHILPSKHHLASYMFEGKKHSVQVAFNNACLHLLIILCADMIRGHSNKIIVLQDKEAVTKQLYAFQTSICLGVHSFK